MPRRWIFVTSLAVTSACADGRAPEPVHFAALAIAEFDDGGALTDAWADYDLDGDPDRFVGFNAGPSRLYRNDRVEGFTDVAIEVGLTMSRSVRTSAWGDFDADGDPDLFLGYAGEAPVTALYRNDGAAGFVNAAGDVGLELTAGTTRQAVWVDFDEDGDMDLFLAMRDGANRMFENHGVHGFIDRAPELGLADARHTVGAVWFDTGDGGLDLLVGNMDGDANALFMRSTDGFIERVDALVQAGGRAVGDPAQGTVRPCVVDYDADGDLDMFFANYGPNGLLERLDAGGYRSVAPELGLANDSHYDSCAWGDFDNDGRVDLYVNGTVGGGVHYRDWLMRREGGAAFVDVTPPDLLELNASHGVTWVDFDMDGDLDLSLAGAADDGMHRLMQNLLRPEYAWHSLQIRVLDESGHATRAGSEVRLYDARSKTLLGTRVVDSGSGYDAQSDLPVHFGVPGGQPVDVEITVFSGGQRHVAAVLGVDPRQFTGRAATVRVDSRGGVAGGSLTALSPGGP